MANSGLPRTFRNTIYSVLLGKKQDDYVLFRTYGPLSITPEGCLQVSPVEECSFLKSKQGVWLVYL